MGSPGLARLGLLASALLFSTGGAAIKACSLNAWQVASGRSALAFVALILLVPASRRRWTRTTLLVGAAYAATMILYVVGNKLTTAANTIFLQSTAPLHVLLLGPWLLGERSRRRDLLLMAALTAGMALFFVGNEPPQLTAPHPRLGNLAALAAGLCWGLTLIGLRRLGRDEGAGSAAGAVAAGNLIACLAVAPLWGPPAAIAGSDLLLLLYLGVFQIGLAYVFLTRAMRVLPALEASLLLLAEPVINPLWALLFQREIPSLWSAVGGGVILTAVALHSIRVDARTPAG